MPIIFILLSLWLWRPPEKPNWRDAGSPISPLALSPDPQIYGTSLYLNVSLLLALGQCNIDKARILKIETSRASL